MSVENSFVLLFTIASAVALLTRWLKIPHTIALVVAGIGLGAAQAVNAPHLTKDLLYAVFLPGLLFEAAYHLEARCFWRNKLALLTLAVPGVAGSMIITA